MIAERYLWAYKLLFFAMGLYLVFFVMPEFMSAKNINRYSDTITNSAPNKASNHTLNFRLDTAISPGSYIEIKPPAGFEILDEPTFSAVRNVQLLVDGIHRDVGPVRTATDDFVEITPGTPGMIRYTLNSTYGIAQGSTLTLKIGNHTSVANGYSLVFSTSTGTTTVPADILPIVNAPDEGTYSFDVRIYDGTEVADAGFVIALINQVGVGPLDTTETIPPERFNGAPTGTLSGTTVSVELSLETNEFAICKYSLIPDTSYDDAPSQFSNTGLIFHSTVVTVAKGTLNKYYIRCMDDENNKNIDDYLIAFSVNEAPTGISNTEGSTTGNGTGSGNSGTGDGTGAGGTTGGSSGSASTAGTNSGGGGSGGGGGGGGGANTGTGAGGGFESTPGPYRSGDAQVTITGYTSPRTSVTGLVDGKIAQVTTSDGNGAFTLVIKAIARGAYTFGVYATDAQKVKSSTFSTSFTVTGARESSLSNIMIPPSILVTPNPVNPGQTVAISGFTIPNATVTIENEKDGNTSTRKPFSGTSNSNGEYTINIDTTGFSTSAYKVRAKAEQVGSLVATNFSNYTIYGVGQAVSGALNTDLNRDGKVNLVDFSILLFWWNSNGGTSDPPADINGDGKVSLTDFSILLFNWTG